MAETVGIDITSGGDVLAQKDMATAAAIFFGASVAVNIISGIILLVYANKVRRDESGAVSKLKMSALIFFGLANLASAYPNGTYAKAFSDRANSVTVEKICRDRANNVIPCKQ